VACAGLRGELCWCAALWEAGDALLMEAKELPADFAAARAQQHRSACLEAEQRAAWQVDLEAPDGTREGQGSRHAAAEREPRQAASVYVHPGWYEEPVQASLGVGAVLHQAATWTKMYCDSRICLM
jgi:hypothetical protein